MLKDRHLYEDIDHLLVRLASRAHSDIDTLIDIIREDLNENIQ